MDVEDAFTEEAISTLDTNISDEVEIELTDIIKRVYTSNEIAVSDDDVKIGILCFIAGRTYQRDLDSYESTMLNIPMTPDEVHEYIAYLSQKGAT